MAGTHQKRRCIDEIEIGTILRLGWPNSVSGVLNFLPGMVMLHFLGTDSIDLAAGGMGFMFVNVLGQSLIVGTGIGSVTLISQAFGAHNFVRCGEILQRQLAIHFLVVLLISVGFWQCEQVLSVFGQPSVIAERAAKFVRWRLPALPSLAIIRDCQNYLLAQRIMHFPMVVGCTSNLLVIALFVVLIPRLGFVGAPVAITIANTVNAAGLILFTRRYLPHRESWPHWRFGTAFSGWRELLEIGLPAGALQLGEWWAWECNLFLAGRLCSNARTCAALDVFPIVSNTMVILFNVHNGFSLAAGAMVGNALGAGDPRKACRVSRQVMLLVATIAGLLAFGLHMLQDDWGQLFTNDAPIIRLTSQVVPWVALYVFVDSLGPGALVNVLRNAGVVRIPAFITYVAFYFIGIPCGIALAFPTHRKTWGVTGLWAGLDVGIISQVSSLLIFFHCFLDWERLAVEAQARSKTMESDACAERSMPNGPRGKATYQPVSNDAPSPDIEDCENGCLSQCQHVVHEDAMDELPATVGKSLDDHPLGPRATRDEH